jgi:penicillin G amidase
VRTSGDGFMPSDGASGAGDWTSMLNPELLPQTVDPPQGRLVNANNRLVDAGYRHFISRDWDAPYRAGRIEALLEATPQQSLDTSVALLRDIYSPMSADLLPLLAAAPATAPTRAARALLAAWDGAMDRNQPEPLIFAAWARALTQRIVMAKFGDLNDGGWAPNVRTIKRLILADSPWCDDLATPSIERCPEQVEAALADAVADLTRQFGGDPARWRWGDAHKARHSHPILRDLIDVTLETDGGFDTVNRGAFRPGRLGEPFDHVHGAGYRAAYDLADPARSVFGVATGQSGHPLSRHFTNLAERWRAVDLRPLTGDRAALLGQGAERLVLSP